MGLKQASNDTSSSHLQCLRKYKFVAQVILRWHLQRGIVIIPKSTHYERMVENFSIFDRENQRSKSETFDIARKLQN